ncbi:RNA-directed DNA polymerase, eukaryota [Tanacetum coccineum]
MANFGLDSSIPFPPGFTPEREFQHVDAQEVQGMENSLSKRRSEGLSSRILEDAQPLNEHASPNDMEENYWTQGDPQVCPMNCLSLNVQGLGSKAKKDWIKELNNKHKVNFLSVQETKLDCISDMDVKVLCEYTFHDEAVGILVVMGDFNEVRCMEDRLGSVYNAQGANEFNSFISNSGLVEIQLEGYSFTWSLQSAKKMSKLDRFFVSDGLLSLFPHLSGICLDRHPLGSQTSLLREVVTDYGPSPFRVSPLCLGFKGSIKCVLELEIILILMYNTYDVSIQEEITNHEKGDTNISPGRGRVTFEFSERFCDTLGSDFCAAVGLVFRFIVHFLEDVTPLSCSHSKNQDPKFVNDYRPISLIGSLYKLESLQQWGRFHWCKLKARLSNWKLKTLSVGGRLTLLKSVLGSTPIYNMSIYKVPKSVLQTMESIRRNFFNGVQCDERKIVWIKWAKVLASKKYGGLGVSVLIALNRRSLCKMGLEIHITG